MPIQNDFVAVGLADGKSERQGFKAVGNPNELVNVKFRHSA